ncbi:Fibronectin type III domain-containing protein isoform 1 [Dorcoceras hygrometricum]|uniref:Fibronectin type III domain-containing protein isoform 1 n=1 Tax=Dorcoceras hygrometricum TaxID=472368 RepID=A0A2Z7C2Y6_9LAMI|nr:Fibronectin type III domain-containing protein isoform 1 [Dorcoceras hygrometricum]
MARRRAVTVVARRREEEGESEGRGDVWELSIQLDFSWFNSRSRNFLEAEIQGLTLAGEIHGTGFTRKLRTNSFSHFHSCSNAASQRKQTKELSKGNPAPPRSSKTEAGCDGNRRSKVTKSESSQAPVDWLRKIPQNDDASPNLNDIVKVTSASLPPAGSPVATHYSQQPLAAGSLRNTQNAAFQLHRTTSPRLPADDKYYFKNHQQLVTQSTHILHNDPKPAAALNQTTSLRLLHQIQSTHTNTSSCIRETPAAGSSTHRLVALSKQLLNPIVNTQKR